jgi:predicted metal-dependent phosphoesterase TrpH
LTEHPGKLPPLTIRPDTVVDLHMHTTYSDGRWPVTQLLDYLVQEQFELISVTDHDCVDTVAEIQALGAARGLPILPGVEMSTTWQGKVVHLLCYGFDPAQNALAGIADDVRDRQLENTQQVNQELQKRGYQFPRQQEVLAATKGQLFRPIDNVTLLIEHGHVPDRQTGLRLIHEAGFQSILADLPETVEAAHRSGAICIFAHPGRSDSGFTYYRPEMLDAVYAEAPFDGVEVYHPYHNKEKVAMYLDYVKKHDLLLSTGSDSHCYPGRMPLKYQAETSRALLERLGVVFEV